MQRAQLDDDARNGGHRPDPLIRAARAETQPAIYSCAKAGQEHKVREPVVADEPPDVLGRIELGAFRRERHKRDVGWYGDLM